MNCKNCPYNNGSGDKISRPVITHPQGNFLNLSIAITTRAVSVVDGVENVEEAEMDISNNLLGKPIVELTRGRKVYRYECDTFQNKVQFYDSLDKPLSYFLIIESVIPKVSMTATLFQGNGDKTIGSKMKFLYYEKNK